MGLHSCNQQKFTFSLSTTNKLNPFRRFGRHHQIMIEKTLKTTHGKLKISIPTQLGDVTLGQMIALQDKPHLNDIEAISILSGISADELGTVSNANDFQAFGSAVLSLSYQIKYLYNSEAIPKEVAFTLDGPDKKPMPVKIKTMQNLSVEPAGAFMAAREIIAEEIEAHIKQHGDDDWKENFNPSLKACCQILAHYFFCRATGKKYNEYQAEEFCSEIKKMRVTEALPIAKHFFTCYPNLSKQKTSFWRGLLPRWKNVQVFNRSGSSVISIQ